MNIEPTELPQSWRERPFFQTSEALRPWIQWLLIVISFGFGWYVYQRDTNAQNIVTLGELQKEQAAIKTSLEVKTLARNKEMDDIRRQMLTREVFEAYHSNDLQRLDRIEKLLEQLIERRSQP